MAKLREVTALRELYMTQLTECLDLARSALITPTLRNLFDCRYAHIETVRNNFSLQHSHVIACLATQANPNFEEADAVRKTFDDRYYECMDIHLRIVSLTATSVSASQPNSSAQNGSSVQVRLPKLSLPTFNGNLSAWATFIDLFDTLIHNNAALQPIEKFQYLTMSLSGDPLSIVKSVATTSDNYAVAYQALVDRYKNKRVLASTYWNAIQKASNIDSDSHVGLRALLNTFSENLAALDQLNIDKWDFAIFNGMLSKLDPTTRKQFELLQKSSEIPTFDELRKFVEQQCSALEASAAVVPQDRATKLQPVGTQKGAHLANRRHPMTNMAQTSQKCAVCSDNHMVFQCRTFQSKSSKERFNIAKKNGLCINCLKGRHRSSECPSVHHCRTCKGRHHTLLHFDNSTTSVTTSLNATPSTSQVTSTPTASSSPTPTSLCTNTAQSMPQLGQVLLATIQFQVLDKNGTPHRMRALVDTGSQVSLVLKRKVQRLGLPQTNTSSMAISGIGETPASSCGLTQLQVGPITKGSPLLALQAVVVPKICAPLPSHQIDPSDWTHITGLTLADPEWYKPAPIDILLGADVYSSIVQNGIVSSSQGIPIAVNTIFGWIVMGPVGPPSNRILSLLTTFAPSLEETVQRFWEIESVPSKPSSHPEDTQVEKHFKSTVFRVESGRFGVALPFKGTTKPTFRGSQTIADRRWIRLEARLQQQPVVYDLYLEFMRDYLSSGHMSLVTGTIPESSYVIPHHGVIKCDRGETKIRVVFDASAKDDSQRSLNDTLHTGPKLQNDIVSILLRFRTRPFVFVCDIRQMYRQILVHEEDKQYQYIRFRFSVDSPLQTYQLNTITYGVSTAPYLAIRTLLHLAQLDGDTFPLAAHSIQTDLYVDDFVVGRDTLEEIRELKAELIGLLARGRFELRKWASNHPQIVADLPSEHLLTRPNTFDSTLGATLCILGLSWDYSADSLFFHVVPGSRTCTKRAILSQVARIYDPLGILAPVSLLIKHLIQHLWKLGLDWDAPPPSNVEALWHRLIDELTQLNALRIPRHVVSLSADSIQLHGFCDASQKGYAAVVYLRCSSQQQISTRLLIAKSKVAPLNNKRIARLELCAATLLVKLVSFVKRALDGILLINEMYAWTDSMVTLHWLASAPFRWKTYVSNRVAFVQENLPDLQWRHVPGTDNPADAPSRGLLPSELLNHPSWFTGPTFLSSLTEPWQQKPQFAPSEAAEVEAAPMTLTCQVVSNPVAELVTRCSSLQKIVHVVARIRRWYVRLKTPELMSEPLTELELNAALTTLVRESQRVSFAEDIARIQNGKQPSNQLRKLSPFLDLDGVLRVGSRLAHANVPSDTKHPALLPQRSRLTSLIIDDYHTRNCHTGILSTIHLLRQRFWILSDRRVVTRRVRNCVRCVRTNPKPYCPPMGNLPAVRVNQAKAFSVTGVDYAGPFAVTMLRKRGARAFKVYVCLFICCATKAIHIEVATDLTVDAFLAALRRFTSRRGRCSHLLSDCGTNFVGANNELSRIMQESAQVEGIQWSFNPPSAPHFGGLWESGVKSFKTHLRRVVGNQTLSFEEFITLTTQIEAILNSRPLTAISPDPNDLLPLTPGHFLTLEPLTAPPDHDLSHLKLSRLSRWQLVQSMQQEFWRRWHKEYLHTLHQRSKWIANPGRDPNIGSLVLVKDDNSPPFAWRTARIVELHKGTDGIARVATIRTSNGLMKRPLVKLCALPSNESQD